MCKGLPGICILDTNWERKRSMGFIFSSVFIAAR